MIYDVHKIKPLAVNDDCGQNDDMIIMNFYIYMSLLIVIHYGVDCFCFVFFTLIIIS